MCESVQITKRDKSPNVGMVISAFTENLLFKRAGAFSIYADVGSPRTRSKIYKKTKMPTIFFMPNLAIEMLR